MHALDRPLFDLGPPASELGKESECRQRWSEYLAWDRKSPWPVVVKKFLNFENSKPSLYL
jgi:hypothetical protein